MSMLTNNLMKQFWKQTGKGDEINTPLNFVAVESNSSVALNAVGEPSPISLQYSLNGTSWRSYAIGTIITLSSIGDRVFFRGNNTTFSSSGTNYYIFTMTGTIKAFGNINSLYDATCKSLTLPSQESFFAYLFYEGISLIRAPLLPSTTLRTRCYANMFRGTSIEEPPELPGGLKTYCYQRMFFDCLKLKRTPKITRSTTTYNGPYMEMCKGCSSLSYVHCTLNAWLTTSNATTDWLDGVADTGTFVCPSSLDTSIRDASHIPLNWTIETYDSPATLTFNSISESSSNEDI